MKSKKVKVITIRVDEDTYERIARLSFRYEWSISHVVSRILRNFFLDQDESE